MLNKFHTAFDTMSTEEENVFNAVNLLNILNTYYRSIMRYS